MSLIDSLDVVMGAELTRPVPEYIAQMVTQPVIVHDFSAVPAAVVRMKRFGHWSDPGSYTESARRRDRQQIIGTDGARGLHQSDVTISLNEYTGPSAGDPNDPTRPGNLRIEKQTLIEAQRNLYSYQTPDQFHDSIGSTTLFEDYRRFKDSVYVNLLLSANEYTSTTGVLASSTSGGYFNPKGVLNGGSYTAANAHIFNITEDLDQVVTDMRTRLVPPFQSEMGPVYHCLASPNFMRALRRDSRFLEVTRYPGYAPAQMTASIGLNPVIPPLGYTSQPNVLNFTGGFQGTTGWGYSGFMPTGLYWGGVRFFECTNLPRVRTSLAKHGGSVTDHDADIGIFFGRDTIGQGIWGQGPQVCLNENTDYRRFIIAIWQEYAGYVVLDRKNVTVARTIP